MIVGVISYVRMGVGPVLVISIFVLMLLQQATAGNDQSIVHAETLLRTSSSWDGDAYKSYPPGQPELSILKITLAPHTQWNRIVIRCQAYIVAGELTIERKKDGKKRQFTSGQAVSETVGTFRRGVAGNEPIVLIVFYAGSRGLSLTQHPCSLNLAPTEE